MLAAASRWRSAALAVLVALNVAAGLLVVSLLHARGGVRARAGGAARRRAAAAPPPFFRAEIRNLRMRAPAPWHEEVGDSMIRRDFLETYPTGVPVWVLADLFLQCGGPHAPRVVGVSRTYRRTDIDHAETRVGVGAGGDVEWLDLAAPWSTNGVYESSAWAAYVDAPGGGAPRAAACAGGARALVDLTVAWRNATTVFRDVAPSPESPRTEFAMVAVFSQDMWLLPMWTAWWIALGVETFYFFPNAMDPAKAAAQLAALRPYVANISAHVVVVDWRMLHWFLSESGDVTYGQPMAINDALQRWRHLHGTMLFYDPDEFLVLPRHDGLASFIADYEANSAQGSYVALRSQCLWARLELLPGENIVGMGVEAFATRALSRQCVKAHHAASALPATLHPKNPNPTARPRP